MHIYGLKLINRIHPCAHIHMCGVTNRFKLGRTIRRRGQKSWQQSLSEDLASGASAKLNPGQLLKNRFVFVTPFLLNNSKRCANCQSQTIKTRRDSNPSPFSHSGSSLSDSEIDIFCTLNPKVCSKKYTWYFF
jgi:hypothetical protein